MPYTAAKPMIHALKSAIASASQEEKGRERIISMILVDEGPAIKRRWLRARGYATPIQKRMSHITIGLETIDTPLNKKRTSVKEVKEEK